MLFASYFSYLLFPLLGIGLYLGNLYTFPAAGFIFVFVPLLDLIFGKDHTNYNASSEAKHVSLALSFSPIGFIFFYLVFLLIYAYYFESMTLMEKFFSIISIGAVGSIAITASHELIHKRNSNSKYFGQLGLVLVCYSHFEVSHLYGHHRYSCTHKDNSTAWYNESFYSFLFRTIPGCFRFSWSYEKRRLLKSENSNFLSNRVIRGLVFQILFAATLVYLFGTVSLILFFTQAIIAIVLLENVSYIEHYGLMRDRSESGYSRMGAHHSWNSYHRFSNYLVFMLQRHADHHSVADKEYYMLQTDDSSPELPFGYSVMATYAFIPPIWRKIMNPLCDKAMG
ncbi:hypothetical protein AB833_21680 [Chromatiales bacterium (ex Bugula neritina AB1)]|nr:hypothetical protein AB833_21680 [Chromatiales bacterium (ex Bugula neritina AB1)]